MASPSTAITRFDLGIAYNEFSSLANRRKFIGLKVLPPLGVSQEAGEFMRIKIGTLMSKPEDTRRAPKATYRRDSFEWDKDNYALTEHGVEEVSDDATIERYGDVVRAEQISVIRGVNRMLTALENEIAAAVFNTTTWTGSALTTDVDDTNGGATSGHKWSVKASADPILDIDFVREKVKNKSLMAPNALICSDTAFLAMIRTDRIENLLKYDATSLLFALQSGQNQSDVMKSTLGGLAALLNLEHILIGQGFKNTADKGQTATAGRLWDTTKAMVCHIRDDGMSGDLESVEPTIGRVLFSTKNGEPLPGTDDAGYGSLLFDEYREEQVRGSIFRPRNKYQVKILHPEAGHLLTNVT